MEFIMIDAFKGASGKICGHSDMGVTYNGRTGKTYSHKRCNNRDLQALPYSQKELDQQAAFKTRSAVISTTIKSLSEGDRKALIVVRNARGLYSYRQLIDEIYDKQTNTVPVAALAELVAQGKKGVNVDPNANPNANPNSNTGGSGSGSGGGSGSGNTSGSGSGNTSGSGGGTTPGDDSGDIA